MHAYVGVRSNVTACTAVLTVFTQVIRLQPAGRTQPSIGLTTTIWQIRYSQTGGATTATLEQEPRKAARNTTR